MEKELTQIWDDVVEGSSDENKDSQKISVDWQSFLDTLNNYTNIELFF